MTAAKALIFALIACTFCASAGAQGDPSTTPPIDRRALVTRHNVTLTHPDPLTPLSVGNGEFAFTADITGLQTFPAWHETGMPLGAQSHWGWHTLPNPDNHKVTDILEEYTVAGRKVPYAADGRSGDYSPAGNWLRANPHRLHLGQIGLALKKADGRPAAIDDLAATTQTLDLWTGMLTSRFEIDGVTVTVQTVCHPQRDLLAVRVTSPLFAQNRLAISLAFPYGADQWRNAADWTHPERHTTTPEPDKSSVIASAYNVIASEAKQSQPPQNPVRPAPSIPGSVIASAAKQSQPPQQSPALTPVALLRTIDNDRYHVAVVCSPAAKPRNPAPHQYEFSTAAATLDAVFAFSPDPVTEPLPDFPAVKAAAADHWQRFWTTGGVIDFSACTDPRAPELERRVILSQYLTAIQCAGSRPPQETGLTCNSWYGKFHLEMHWWHAVHFALWNRIDLLERSLPWYESILPAARATAQMQGYRGARWPKMTAPNGRESPSRTGVFLIWQQPHPIYYAELCYRAHPDRKTLDRYKRIVFATADFMASYATWDEAGNRYVLGPALIPAQESYGPTRDRNLNPTFELAYWHWALQTAQTWRRRLDLAPDPDYGRVLSRLAKPAARDGLYTAIETEPYTIYRDHPSMLAAYGLVPPTPLIDPDIMKRTYDHILQTWDWPSTWGWDYPMLAMTAARLGQPEKAVDALFLDSPKNRYLANGHNYQSARLPLYLPGNGGLLTATAMMAAGWTDAPNTPNPGFPKNGRWLIHHESLSPLP